MPNPEMPEPDVQTAEPPETLGPPETHRLESVIESLLFAADHPLAIGELKKLLGERDGKQIDAALAGLASRRAGSGVEVVNVAGGWQLRTNAENAAYVGKLLAGRPVRLSRALLETLAVVAYRQPVTRPEIDEIRGVDCGPVLATLLDRGLVRIIGKKEEVGRPLLYATTPDFLRIFNLRDLGQLPALREFHELTAENRARVDAEHGDSDADVSAPVAAGPGPARLSPHPGFAEDPDEGGNDALLQDLEEAALASARATQAAVLGPEA